MERARTDLHRVLQVDPAANPAVIQAAYGVLAQIFHADVSGDDAEMKRLNAAWQILGDARRRREYDIERAGRHHGFGQPAATAGTPTSPAPATEARSARREDRAGSPAGEPLRPPLKFGRYEGWTLGQVSRVDRSYLEWLHRAPARRGFKDEIDAVLRTRRGPGSVDERRTYDTDRQQRVHTWAPGAPTRVR